MILTLVIIITIIFSIMLGAILVITIYEMFDLDLEFSWKLVITFICAISLLLGVGIPLEIKYYNSQYENIICEIISLKSEVGVSGKFFLGYGYIDTETYYFFYTQDDKGYKLKKIRTSEAYINVLEESKYETPTLTQKKNKGEWNDYSIIYIPQDYIVFDFNI